jgi:hypothetical protein
LIISDYSKAIASYFRLPNWDNETIFQKGFEIAEISCLNVEQYEQYKQFSNEYGTRSRGNS